MPGISNSNRHTARVCPEADTRKGSWVTITAVRKTLLVTNICWPNDLDENRRCKILKRSDVQNPKKVRLYRWTDLTMSKSLKTEYNWIISGWKEKELFKPVDIANNIPFNFLITQAEKKSG